MTDQSNNEEREAMLAGDRALTAEEADEVGLLADLLSDSSTWAEPPSHLEDDVLRAVAEAPAATGDGSQRQARVAKPQRRSRAAMGALAIAAALLVVVGVGVAVSRSSTSSDFETQLAATELIPGAHGSAQIAKTDSGFRINLEPEGLPPLAEGEYYQGWLKNAEGVTVPIGTFSSSDAKVTLWSGVSPAEFPTMTVTIEAADGNQASSGRVVLAGPITAD